MPPCRAPQTLLHHPSHPCGAPSPSPPNPGCSIPCVGPCGDLLGVTNPRPPTPLASPAAPRGSGVPGTPLAGLPHVAADVQQSGGHVSSPPPRRAPCRTPLPLTHPEWERAEHSCPDVGPAAGSGRRRIFTRRRGRRGLVVPGRGTSPGRNPPDGNAGSHPSSSALSPLRDKWLKPLQDSVPRGRVSPRPLCPAPPGCQTPRAAVGLF